MKTKKILIQVGKKFYSLKLEFEVKKVEELLEVADKYDIRVLVNSIGIND